MDRFGAVFILLWCLVVLFYSGIHDFWGDEISSLIGADENINTIVFGGGSDFHPPLYFIILHEWIRFFGRSEQALRSLSILFAGLAMMLLSILSVHLRGERKTLPVFFLGLSPFWIQFSCMARYYSLSTCMFLLFLVYFVHARQSITIRNIILAGIFLALTGYTNYIVFGTALIIVVSEIFVSSKIRKRLNIAFICITALVLISPLISLVMRQTQRMMTWGETAQFAGLVPTVIISLIYPIYSFSISETVMPWTIWITIPGLATVFFLLFKARRRSFLYRVLIIGLLFGVGVITIIARSLPLVYVPSRLLFLLPIWMLLLSEGISRIRYAHYKTVAMTLLFIVYLYGNINLVLGREYHNSTYIIPWKSIVKRIREDPEPNPLVVTTEEYPLFHYGPELRFQLVRPGRDVIAEIESKYPSVIWLVERDRADPQRRMLLEPLESWLNRCYERDAEYHYLPRSTRERKVREIIQGGHTEPETVGLTRFTRTW